MATGVTATVTVEGDGERVRGDEVAFERLHALVARGYVPELGTSESLTIRLDHPSKKVRYETLILDANGDVHAPLAAVGDGEFFADERAKFQNFLRTIPYPNWWERTRFARDKMVVWTVVMALCAAMWWLIVTVLRLITA
jgi:hypothetical protein